MFHVWQLFRWSFNGLWITVSKYVLGFLFYFQNYFVNHANHEIIKNPFVFIGYSALGTFRTRSIFQRFPIQNRIIFASFFHDFSCFWASIFASILSSIFNGKMLPKWTILKYPGAPKIHTFRDLLDRSICWWILVALWLALGTPRRPGFPPTTFNFTNTFPPIN